MVSTGFDNGFPSAPTGVDSRARGNGIVSIVTVTPADAGIHASDAGRSGPRVST